MFKFKKTVLALAFLAAVSVPSFSKVCEPQISGGLNLIGSIGGDCDSFTAFPSGTVFFDLFFYPFSGKIENLGIAWGIGYIYAKTSRSDLGWSGYYSDDTLYDNSFMPMYAAFKLKFPGNSRIVPFARVDIGGTWWWPDERLLDPPTLSSDYTWWVEFCWSIGGGIDMGDHLSFGLKLSSIPCYFSNSYRNIVNRYYNEREVNFTFLTAYATYRF